MNYSKLVGAIFIGSSFYFLWVFPFLLFSLAIQDFIGRNILAEINSFYVFYVSFFVGIPILIFGIIIYKGKLEGIGIAYTKRAEDYFMEKNDSCKSCGESLEKHTHTMRNVCQVELNDEYLP